MGIIKRKRIYLNKNKTRYCNVRLYSDKLEMQEAYKKYKPGQEEEYYKIAGCHLAYTIFKIAKDGTETLSPNTGIVLLCYERCGAGIISHEFGHAVLWAWKHHLKKDKYPIVIRDLEDEEEILYALTSAVSQFYRWLYRIEKVFQPS